MAIKKQNFEQAIKKLEEIVEKMENDSTNLEDSMNLYKQGMELAVFCSERLQAIEKEIIMIEKTVDGEIEERLFTEE